MKKNTKSARIICIGDVHGCYDELLELLELVKYNKESGDRLIFVGDLVDRGPKSAEVVKFVRELGVECVMGNHDEKLTRYHKHELRHQVSIEEGHKKVYTNPMNLTSQKKKTYGELSKEDLDWMTGLPDIIHIKELNLAVLHGGVKPGTNPLKQAGGTYRHCRYVFNKTLELAYLDTFTFKKPEGTSLWSELYDGDIHIVYGHNVESIKEPVFRTNMKGAQTFSIDTGCCFGGRMTAFVVEPSQSPDKLFDYSYVQVDAHHNYSGK